MAHLDSNRRILAARSPCTRRDGPKWVPIVCGTIMFSLHAQGWPSRRRIAGPTQARSPCTRRDGPPQIINFLFNPLFSLHAQGWPARIALPGPDPQVLPARAGMARPDIIGTGIFCGSPCTRRDGPFTDPAVKDIHVFSLHAQGWPLAKSRAGYTGTVLPARAGMAREHQPTQFVGRCSPCTRRGTFPIAPASSPPLKIFSPQAKNNPLTYRGS